MTNDSETELYPEAAKQVRSLASWCAAQELPYLIVVTCDPGTHLTSMSPDFTIRGPAPGALSAFLSAHAALRVEQEVNEGAQ